MHSAKLHNYLTIENISQCKATNDLSGVRPLLFQHMLDCSIDKLSVSVQDTQATLSQVTKYKLFTIIRKKPIEYMKQTEHRHEV